jgi:hypothetical protein
VLNFITLLYNEKTGAPAGTVEYRETGTLGSNGNPFTFSGDYDYYKASGESADTGSYKGSSTRLVAGSPLPKHF